MEPKTVTSAAALTTSAVKVKVSKPDKTTVEFEGSVTDVGMLLQWMGLGSYGLPSFTVDPAAGSGYIPQGGVIYK